MRRVPLLSGSKVVLVPIADDDVVVWPPPPPEPLGDVSAAVRDALRFPLSGPSLEAIAPRGGRATIVVQPPALPLPGAAQDPRRLALAETMAELERHGIPGDRLTILVAGGLGRRPGRRELERLLPPPQARAYRGKVVVHDAEGEDLVRIAGTARVHPAVLESDMTLVVGAAETVLSGGPGTIADACDAASVRSLAGAGSLLEAAGLDEWEHVLGLQSELARRVPLLGVSLALDLPRLTGAFRGYPHDPNAVEKVIRSWSRAVFSRLPGGIRRDILTNHLSRRIAATAVFAGPPSVAHAEALLRGVELRGARLAEPVDALVVGAPWIGPHHPYEPENPVTTAATVLGLALRLRRDAFPIRQGGTLVLVHPLSRRFTGGTQVPYVAMFTALRAAASGVDLAEAERNASSDPRALDAYRAGKACHPLLPYADWAGCAPALAHLGQVVVAGCRDAIAARTLGFVPSHGIASALEMAHGVAGGRARLAVLLAPPYPPLLVG